MKSAWLGLRSAFFWTLSILHFVPAVSFAVVLGKLFGSRRADPFVRLMCRNIVRLTGARLRVTRSATWDPGRIALYAGNHVNIFDPFFYVAALNTYVRGIELESHFSVPIYGQLMKTMGNVPVPSRVQKGGFEVMRQRIGEALARGTSLIWFPEGTRTRTGRLGKFRTGVFRMAVELGVPVVPVSQVGAFELKRVGNSRLGPSTVHLTIHDPLEPGDDPEALCARVREILAADLGEAPAPDPDSAAPSR